MKCVIVVLSVCIGVALAYSTGAPVDACDNLTPQHGPVQSQKSPAPYSLIVEPNKVQKGGAVKVTVRGNGVDDKIKGFLFQARDGTLPVGEFKVIDRVKSQLLSCNAQKGNSITHKKITGDTTEVIFQWFAPRDFNGQVNIVGTVALNGGVFWNNLRSETITVQ